MVGVGVLGSWVCDRVKQGWRCDLSCGDVCTPLEGGGRPGCPSSSRGPPAGGARGPPSPN
eukprot:1161140-Prorocentrum_minimum.AAC.1